MRWSITTQFLVPFLLVLLGVVGVGTWASLAATERAAWRQVETQVKDVGRVLSEGTFPLTEQVLQQVKGLSGLEMLWGNQHGERLATFPGAATLHLPEMPVAGQWQDLRLEPVISLQGQPYRWCRLQIQKPGRTAGTLYLFYPEARWHDTLQQAQAPVWLLGGVGGVLTAAAAALLSRRMARRVQVLVRQTQAIAAGDFRTAPSIGGSDEWADLGAAINDMATQLAHYRETLQQTERLRLLHQLSSSLVHHLRNGLTGARLAVQLHLQETGETAEPLQVALRQLTLLQERLQRLRDLTHLKPVTAQPCDLPALVTEAVALLTPQSKHLQVRLQWTPPGGIIQVEGDRSQLEHLLWNVLGNAIEAAGPGGEVALHLQVVAGQAMLEVIDTGPGPPPELAARLFEPFVSGKPEGLGLGLAIAKQAAEQMGGSLRWCRRHERTVFTIQLPCRTQDSQQPST